MAVKTLRLSELLGLSPEEKRAALLAFAANRNQPLNGELAFLEKRIAVLESRYEMSSDTMRGRLSRGEIKETAELGVWLMLLHVRDSIAKTT